MKLYLFHGPGIVGMNNKISEIRREFDPLSITEVSDLSQIETGSLFSDKRLVIVEGNTDLDLSKLPDDDNLTLVVKFSKTLASNSVLLKNLPKGAIVIAFEEAKETSIFPFLDLLSEKNTRALNELNKHIDEWGVQYVLTMMVYSLRRFIQKKDKLSPYVLQKIESQRKNFPLSKIKSLYREILVTDYKIKQGLLDEKIGAFMLAQRFIAEG